MRHPAQPGRRACLVLLAAAPAAGVLRAQDLADLVARTRDSVLPVGTYSAIDNPRFAFRGSGFAVGDGTSVVTNFHVLPAAGDPEGAPTLMVQVPRGRGELEGRPARLLATDRAHDLALLKIEGPPVRPLPLDDDDRTREGDAVAIIGFPIGGVLGYSPVTHRGIVSSITRIALPAPTAQRLDERAVARLREVPFDIYQLDATAYPGNSGGPVFDVASGQVVGVINMVLARGTRESALSQPTGITYALPVALLQPLLKELPR